MECPKCYQELIQPNLRVDVFYCRYCHNTICLSAKQLNNLISKQNRMNELLLQMSWNIYDKKYYPKTKLLNIFYNHRKGKGLTNLEKYCIRFIFDDFLKFIANKNLVKYSVNYLIFFQYLKIIPSSKIKNKPSLISKYFQRYLHI